ncbi:MAG: hypothetical protein V1668_02380 [Patescibacteria group bacterium]
MNKKAYWILPVIAIVAMALVVSGCKTTAEKAAEKTIEKATNGAADVDLGTNSVTINTNGGSYQAGDDVKLPDGFPSDVYIIDGTIKAAMTQQTNDSFIVSIEISKSIADAKTAYEKEIVDDGWTITTNMTYGGAVTLMAEKSNRILGVGISDLNGKTTVSITTSTNSTNAMPTPDDN